MATVPPLRLLWRRLRNVVAILFERLGEWAEERSRRLKVCMHCGRSLFYGEGCRGQYLTGCKPGD